ncbi:MAG: alpha/beta hydrolase [Alphaproteobacteria bacterium]|nr:alpha/beta hydrolase [Alphaproteobacteria bacterium]NCQ66439.1 alpha/beta hydrolase [Alphaproteobacteria bacterium]
MILFSRYSFLFCNLLFVFQMVRADLLHDVSIPHDVKVAPDITLRVTHTKAKNTTQNAPKKVVIFLPGRASFFQKNKGLILGITGHDYTGTQNVKLARQADFWCIDMRGHGASLGRLSPNNQRGHIDSFETYLTDIHKVITDTIAPAYDGQDVEFYIMGASMGGHLAVRYLQDYASKTPVRFKRALLIVPMIRFTTAPWPRFMAKSFSKAATFLSFSKNYAAGYGDLDLSKSDFTRFKGHHSREAFDDTNEMMAQNPGLITGGPTYGWVSAAFDSETPLCQKPLPKAVDYVAYVAGNDSAVDSNSTLAFCKQHNIRVKFYPQSRHNILKETKEYAPTFWQDLDLS